MRHLRRALLIAVGLGGTVAYAQQSAWEYQAAETRAYFDGLTEIQYNGWGRVNARVMKVANELVQYSQQVFRIVPGQTFQWGQAHVGGWIILDISTAAGASDEVLAFKLAHEWGHEALGHQPNMYHPMGSAWRLRDSPTEDEDAADAYAGGFLKSAGYSLQPVVTYLRALPSAAPGDSHSDGATRARLVAQGYGDDALVDEPDKSSISSTTSETPNYPPECYWRSQVDGQVHNRCAPGARPGTAGIPWMDWLDDEKVPVIFRNMGYTALFAVAFVGVPSALLCGVVCCLGGISLMSRSASSSGYDSVDR